jgi:hypothetical protein
MSDTQNDYCVVQYMGKVREQNANCRQRYIPGDGTVLSPTDKNSCDFDSTGRVSRGENTDVLSKVSLPPQNKDF